VSPTREASNLHRTFSVIPTRYFLGRPSVGEEMHISIEEGKTLIIRLMAVGPVVEGSSQRDVWFEVNGEVYTSSLANTGDSQIVGPSRLHRR
jgi:pyruvate carboxylase